MSRYNNMILTNYIYFYHLEKYCMLPMYPDSITDTFSVSFSQVDALARTAPVQVYNHSGPRSFNVSLNMHRDMMNDLNINVSNLKDNVVDFSGDDYVDTLVKYLQAASLPRYKNFSTGSKSIIPPMVAIRFGNDIFIKGVVTSSVQVTYTKPILSNGKYAQVNVSFSVTETDPYDADSAVVEGSFRGISRTFKDGIFNIETSAPSYSTSITRSSNNTEKLTDTVSLSTGIVKNKKSPSISTTKGGGNYVNTLQNR